MILMVMLRRIRMIQGERFKEKRLAAGVLSYTPAAGLRGSLIMWDSVCLPLPPPDHAIEKMLSKTLDAPQSITRWQRRRSETVQSGQAIC